MGSSAGGEAASPLLGSGPIALGCVLWIAAMGLGFGAQYLLTPMADAERGGYVFALAGLVAVASAALLDRRSPLRSPSRPTEQWPRWFSFARLGLLLVSVGATGGAIYLLVQQRGYGTAIWLWLAALSAATMAMVSPLRWQRSRMTRAHVWEAALVVAILALAVMLRLPGLDQIPPEVHGDEAACGLEARRILHGEAPNLFTLGWYHIPYLSFAISAASMWLFGDDLFGLRMASVIQGTLSILLFYLIARRLFSVRIALVASVLLAVSHWHIHFSRAGISYMQALFAGLLVFHFLLRGLERLRLTDFLFAGFAVGLCVEVYYAARLVPLLAGLYLLFRLVSERGFLRLQWRGILAMGFGAVLFVAPMGVVYATHPETLLTRTEGVFVLSQNNLKHALYSYKVDRLQDVLLIQTVNTLKAFNLRGETSGQHSHRRPLVDFWTGSLFVLGLAIATMRIYRSPYFLVGIWFWLTLVFGSVLTVDSMFSPRVIIMVPLLFLFPALFIDTGWRAAESVAGRAGTAVFAILVCVFLALAARANYDDYFTVHINADQPAGFNTLVSRFVLANNDRYRVYLMGKSDTSLRYDTEHFLLPDVDGVDVRDAALDLPLDRVPARKGVAFLVGAGLPNTTERLEGLRRVYPDGREEMHRTPRGAEVFVSFVVEHASLVAARPDAILDADAIPGLMLSQLPTPRPDNAPAAASREPAVAAPAAPVPRASGGFEVPGLQEPRAVALGAAGDVYLLDRLNAQVYRFDSNGKLVATIGRRGDGPGLLADPRALAVESDGNLLVLDAKNNLVSRFTPDGHFLKSIALPGGYNPSGMAVDRQGVVFVADTGQSRVVRIRPSGEPIEIIGTARDPRGRLDQPVDVAVSADGEIYVVDIGHRRIVVFGPEGEYRREWPIPNAGTLFGPHIEVLANGVLLSDPEARTLARYDREGHKLAVGCGGEFQRPVGIAVGRDGTVYVADAEARRLKKCALP